MTPETLQGSDYLFGYNELFEELKDWVACWVASSLDKPPYSISLQSSFSDFGMDSIKCVEMVYALEEKTGAKIDPTITWEAPTILELVESVSKRIYHERNAKNLVIKKLPETSSALSDDELMAMLKD